MKIISTVVLILILGCATVRKVGTYSLNRVADLADIVTVTAGVNAYGAKAYIGPLEIGLHKDGIGGYSCLIEHHCNHGNFALFNGMPSGEIGLRKGPAVWTNFGDTVVVNLWERSTGATRMILRGRGGVGIKKDSASMWGDDFEASPEQYTRIGMTGGFLFNGRIEVNPGELVDFLLGFFGIDIFEDDVIKMRPDYLTSMIVSRKSFQEIKKAIDREGEEPDLIVNEYGDTLLHIAAQYCNIKLIQYLVEEKHYNVNQNSMSDPNNIYPKSTPLGAVWDDAVKPWDVNMKHEERSFRNDCIKAANYLESKGGSYLRENSMRFFSNQMVKAVKTDDFKFIEKYYSDVDEL